MQKKNLKNSLVVFPTSRAIRYHLSSLKNHNQLLNKNIAIGEFFSLVILEKNNLNFCDKNLKILYLKEAITNIDIEALGFSGDFSTFLKQSDYIFRFFTETANEYIEFDTLLEFDTYALYSDHIEILKNIHKNYVEILEKNGYTDTILLPMNYKLNLDYIEQFETITINLEGYLSSFEFKIIQEVSKVVDTFINITFNQYNQKNKELFDALKNELQTDFSYKIDLTNMKIVEEKEELKQNQNIMISPLSSQLEQIAFIKYHITQMVQNGLEPESIAVLVPNEQIATSLELFDDEHYFNFAMGRGIAQNKISKVIKLINKILIDFEPKDLEKFKFLKIKEDDFVKLFRDNWNKILNKEIFEQIVNYLFSFEEDEEVLEKLEHLKISLDILLFTNIEDNYLELKVKEFIKLFINQLLSITVDDVSGGKITVLGILETRAVSFDGVIVIDFNDDKIPKLSIKDKFISTKIKELAKLPTITDRENLQRYYYKRVFDKAQQIAICFIDDEQSVMSRFIVQLFENYKEYLVKKEYKAILYTPAQLQHFSSDIILDIDLSKQSWSATSLKSYLTCKRQYYFNYIAKIKEHTISIKPQNFEVGSIIHNCLEEAVKNNNLTNEFIHNYLVSFQKSNPYLVLELELWKKKLEKLVEFEKVRATNGILIESVEQPFNVVYNGVTIKGKIDRIDKHNDGSFEILDYKTSSSLKIDTLKTYEESTDFQLEFYYLSQRDKMIKSVGYYDLNDSSIKSEVVLNEKLEYLDMHLQRLKTTSVNFTLTEKLSSCQFCPYSIICQRD
jgi:CRISPR/Cas system-associated exonuclease Cas4 (RecB family)